MARVWTQDEIDYLYEHVGHIKVETIAKNLKRPPEGVLLKMKRLHISNTKEQAGLYTLGKLAGLLQVDRKTVLHWAENHDLPYIKRKTRNTREFKLIDSIEFWDWAYNHQDRIDFSKLERHAFPPEPGWVESLRHIKREIKGNYYRPWTIKEEQTLLENRNMGLTYKAISKLMNRTPISLENKYKRLLEQNK